MLKWVIQNKEWIFSGIGICVISAVWSILCFLVLFLYRKYNKKIKKLDIHQSTGKQSIQVAGNVEGDVNLNINERQFKQKKIFSIILIITAIIALLKKNVKFNLILFCGLLTINLSWGGYCLYQAKYKKNRISKQVIEQTTGSPIKNGLQSSIDTTAQTLVNDSNYRTEGSMYMNDDISISTENYQYIPQAITQTDQDIDSEIKDPSRSIQGQIIGPNKSMIYNISARSKTDFSGNTITLYGSGTLQYKISELKPLNDFYVELASDYPNQFYKGKYSLEAATLVDLTDINQTGIDFDLSYTVVSLSGQLVFPSTAHVNDIVYVDALCTQQHHGKSLSLAYTGTSHISYEIKYLLPSFYKVSVRSTRYLSQYYNKKNNEIEASIIDATQNSVNAIDFTLTTGNIIFGKVQDEKGKSLANISITLFEADLLYSEVVVYSKSDGSFTFEGLNPQDNYIIFAKQNDSLSFYYGENGITTRSVNQASVISIDDCPIVIQITPYYNDEL